MLVSVSTEKSFSVRFYIPLLAAILLMVLTFKNEISSTIHCKLHGNCINRYDSTVTSNDLDMYKDLLNIPIPKVFDQRNKVLIYSLARSGSSFLGEIFNRHDDVFYSYEPLHTLRALTEARVYSDIEYPEKAQQLIDDFFHCDFSSYQMHLKFISYPQLSNPHFRLMSKVLSSPPFCDIFVSDNSTEDNYKKRCHSLEPKLVERFCKYKKLIVIKELVHRFPSSVITGLLETMTDDNIHAIYLIRDPRAIVWSMMKTGWIGTQDYAFAPSIKAASEKVCRIFINNYIMLEWPDKQVLDRLVVVRYEDLATQPIEVIEKLFSFVNLNLSKDTKNWVVTNTHGQLDDDDIGGTFSVLLRNASYSLNSWRKFLSYEHVTYIQEQCGGIMKKFGYKIYKSKSEVYDTHTPAFTDDVHLTSVLNVH